MGIEFFVGGDGKVWLRHGSKCQTLTASMADLVSSLAEKISQMFPAAYQRLADAYSESSKNRSYHRYRIVERFIRCNMGDDNLMSLDFDGKFMRLERVHCPLRGVCADEHVVCCPQPTSVFSKAEMQVATLYADGMNCREIARRLKKSESTVNCQLWRIERRLGLSSRMDVIRAVRTYGLTTIQTDNL